MNNSKTEEYEVHREGSDYWHKCKYLGSHLLTESDIKRRKILAQSAYNKLKDVFESKKVSVATKNRLLTSHVQSIFLYNSKLWTTKQEGKECNRHLSKKPAQRNTENKVAKEALKRKVVPNYEAETMEHRSTKKKTGLVWAYG